MNCDFCPLVIERVAEKAILQVKQTFQKDRAVVIGSSLAGLMAARALANHFSQVIVFERDVLPSDPVPRKAVPQGRHAHVLLARGAGVMESFFPGLIQDLKNQGAVVEDMSATGIWFSKGRYHRNYRSGIISLQVSRPLLEGYIRQRVCALPNVTLREHCDVIGLLPVKEGSETSIRGVTVMDRAQINPVKEPLTASLVVDAGGRGSRGLAWLESLGYPRPKEELIKMNLSYTTCVYHRLLEHTQGRNPVLINAGQNRRGGAMLAVEGQRWIVTLFGYQGDAAPDDEAGFVAYARTLEAPDIYNVVKTAHPLGPASQYKYHASQRRRFEKLTRFPEGYLICGDALCSFNPIYGQGMTMAASEAALLDECLLEDGPGKTPRSLSRRFFHAASRVLDSPWAIAASNDLIYPDVEGKRTPLMRFSNRYIDWLARVSPEDTTLSIAFLRVANLEISPVNLFHPALVLRVLLGNLKLAAHAVHHLD